MRLCLPVLAAAWVACSSSDESPSGTGSPDATVMTQPDADPTSDDDGGGVVADAGVDGGTMTVDGGDESTDAGFEDAGFTGPPVKINVADYRDRLIAMWLAQCIANWTGLQTEGRYNNQPFLTDADWTRLGLEFVLQDPWQSDDDTDIEFIYLAGLFERNKLRYTPEELQTDWFDHTSPNEFIWVSNLAAQTLMRGTPAVLPPATSLLTANDQSLMIDAQLTTEIFGALSPGMPTKSLDIADLPIRTTASSFSAHAAQFHVVLYSLAAVVDTNLPLREQILWLVRTARRYIPNTSKTADVIDLVVQDYVNNPNVDDWERTRDLVAIEFQSEDAQNGYRYLEWYESSVNLAGGLIALLYGEGDFRRTVRIGSLSGWDSDNGTATMGGLLGLLIGTQAIADAFPGINLSMAYNIARTRPGFDPELWTFGQLADRMLALVELAAVEAGGQRDSGEFSVPAFDPETVDVATDNPLSAIYASSANNLAAVGTPQVEVGNAQPYPFFLNALNAVMADGLEADFSGRDRRLEVRGILEFPFVDAEPLCVALQAVEAGPVSVAVTWSQAVPLAGVRFYEGWSNDDGGSFADLRVEVRVQNAWQSVNLIDPFLPDLTLAFETHALRFPNAITTDGIRISGTPGGPDRFATVCEVDGIVAR